MKTTHLFHLKLSPFLFIGCLNPIMQHFSKSDFSWSQNCLFQARLVFEEGEGSGWDLFSLNREDGRIFLTRSLNASERCVENYPVSWIIIFFFLYRIYP